MDKSNMQATEANEELIKQLKIVRAYFGEHDKTIEEHSHFSTIDRAIKVLEKSNDSE